MLRKPFTALAAVALAFLTACDPTEEPVDNPVNPNPDPDNDVELLLAPAKDTVFEANGIRFDMVYVPGGSFTMGASTSPSSEVYDPDADIIEQPPHPVQLDGFLIADVEVSQFLYVAVMRSNPSQVADLTLPVHNVSYTRAQQFIDSLNRITGYHFRLPTEAEWEYAARGARRQDANTLFAGSDTVDHVAWSSQNSGGTIQRSGQLRPNALGLYDMSGNVLEWCSDWYGSYESGPQVNPQGPSRPSNANLQKRVLRGGSFLQSAYYQRITARQFAFGSKENGDIGLRLAISVKK